MKKLKFIGMVAIMVPCAHAYSQTVVLQIDPAVDTTVAADEKFFANSGYSLGFLIGALDSTAPVMIGKALTFKAGVHFGIRWNKWLANTMEIGWAYTSFPFRQDLATKTFPPPISTNAKEALRCWAIETNLLQRFTYRKKEGRIGNFIEVGAGIDLQIGMDHVTRNELPDGSTLKQVNGKVPYRKGLYATLLAKLGFGRFFFYGQYRLTPLIKAGYGDPKLPAVTIGIGVNT